MTAKHAIEDLVKRLQENGHLEDFDVNSILRELDRE